MRIENDEFFFVGKTTQYPLCSAFIALHFMHPLKKFKIKVRVLNDDLASFRENRSKNIISPSECNFPYKIFFLLFPSGYKIVEIVLCAHGISPIDNFIRKYFYPFSI